MRYSSFLLMTILSHNYKTEWVYETLTGITFKQQLNDYATDVYKIFT